MLPAEQLKKKLYNLQNFKILSSQHGRGEEQDNINGEDTSQNEGNDTPGVRESE